MSKVKDFMDRKAKALHRMRRYESKHKEYVRRKKMNNNEYGGLFESRGWCGYYLYGGKCYIDYEGEVRVNRWYDDEKLVESSVGTVYLCDDNSLRKVVGVREHHIKKINHGKGKNYYRHLASRKLRRKKIDDETPILKRGEYKKEYDVAWLC